MPGEWAWISDAGAPEKRAGHQSVWTGAEMIVWGGENSGFHGDNRNDGARWRPIV
jgi:hypothetical protein